MPASAFEYNRRRTMLTCTMGRIYNRTMGETVIDAFVQTLKAIKADIRTLELPKEFSDMIDKNKEK